MESVSSTNVSRERGNIMFIPRVSSSLMLVALLVAWPLGVTAAQETESGAIPGMQYEAEGARVAPPGMDDTLQPIDGQTEPGPLQPEVRESRCEPESWLPPIALWQSLANLDREDRDNAMIELELGGDGTKAEREAANEIETLWNSGAYEPAIESLRRLEKSGVQMGLGIAWQTPKPPGGPMFATDGRIGGTRAEAQTMSLDFDAQNGSLFTVVLWGSTTGTSAWTVNRSIDGGMTWQETYAYGSSVGLIDVDAVVVDNYLYVAYVAGSVASQARLRRAFVSTGGIDSGYGFFVIFDGGANTIEEVALASNADDFDNRIYYFASQSNDVLRYAWDAASDGTTFTDQSPAFGNPEFGLDATFDYNLSACDDFLYVSYAGNDGHIHVMGRSETDWNDWIVESDAGPYRRTAISAYGENIICAFEYPFTSGTGIRYRISYNCGDSWSPGSLAVPDGTTIFGYFEPDVDARGGDGTAILYQAEAGALDPMYYRTRAGFAPGAWSDPNLFSDHDVYTGSETAMNFLPALGGETFSHGALYLSLDPDFRTLYFDRPTAGFSPCDDATAPIVEIDLPATLSCACDLVDIVGSVSDPDGTYAGDRLEYRRSDAVAWTVADAAVGARSGVLYIWDTSGLTQGFYFVRVVGENECALSASDSTFVYKPTSFGNLDLRAPQDGEVYGGIVCVDGSAWTQSCFSKYTVDYRPTGVGPYNPVDPPNSPYLSTVLNDPLASWNTRSGPSAVPDGVYDVRLEGYTDCGNVATKIHKIQIDNTPPVSEIIGPVPCASVTGMVSIYGTAADANLDHWSLQYTGDGTSDWVTISSGSAPVVSGLLGDWNTNGLPSCAYTLRLVVWDTANVDCSGESHRSEYHVSLEVLHPAHRRPFQ